MSNDTTEITIPLNDIKHLFLIPNCDPFDDKNLTISGIEYAIKQMRMKNLPEKIQLTLAMSKGTEGIDLENLKSSLHRYCMNIVRTKEEEERYLNWQIKRNFIRAFPPLILSMIVLGLITYYLMDERSKFFQILLILLNNFVIILGWVLLWVPAEMFLYDSPQIKREIVLYRLLANADVTLKERT